MIDKQSPIPIYYQLEKGIKDMIENGHLTQGDTLPSEREYAEMFEVSRMTVRQAINNLVNDGYLTRMRGKGTFVASQKIEQTLKGLTSFSEDMRARNMEPATEIIDFKKIKAHSEMIDALKVTEGSEVYELKRVRLADQLPMAYETLYISTSLVPGLTMETAMGSFYQYIEHSVGLRIKNATQTLEASNARKVEGEILQITEGAPVLLIERTSFLENGIPLEYVKSVYRGDRYKFTIELDR
ncbi:GntR family transcriptional regulator [Bacillus pakistanensis]|uniref:GntR family transcriptional regulator n=1 Tax=Rossellomorea pakistanensis TaxID=992288 RepID=A0ABS2NF90_9BACI|nr:GntR family transcriptional regulator [Bacillus pakistanensis]MBM7586226.1 GntR family transcriptional regulator [Bacillus pakistanensis]